MQPQDNTPISAGIIIMMMIIRMGKTQSSMTVGNAVRQGRRERERGRESERETAPAT